MNELTQNGLKRLKTEYCHKCGNQYLALNEEGHVYCDCCKRWFEVIDHTEPCECCHPEAYKRFARKKPLADKFINFKLKDRA